MFQSNTFHTEKVVESDLDTSYSGNFGIFRRDLKPKREYSIILEEIRFWKVYADSVLKQQKIKFLPVKTVTFRRRVL